MQSERGGGSYILCDPRAGSKPINTHCRESAPSSPEHRRGLKELYQGGRGPPPRHEGLAPRGVQAEPQRENKSHGGDCLPDSFPGTHEAWEGGCRRKGALPQGFPNSANHC